LEFVCLAFYNKSKLNRLHLISVGTILKLNYKTRSLAVVSYSPNGILLYANIPCGQVKVVPSWA